MEEAGIPALLLLLSSPLPTTLTQSAGSCRYHSMDGGDSFTSFNAYQDTIKFRDDDIDSHVCRIYFTGSNNPAAAWKLSEVFDHSVSRVSVTGCYYYYHCVCVGC